MYLSAVERRPEIRRYRFRGTVASGETVGRTPDPSELLTLLLTVLEDGWRASTSTGVRFLLPPVTENALPGKEEPLLLASLPSIKVNARIAVVPFPSTVSAYHRPARIPTAHTRAKPTTWERRTFLVASVLWTNGSI